MVRAFSHSCESAHDYVETGIQGRGNGKTRVREAKGARGRGSDFLPFSLVLLSLRARFPFPFPFLAPAMRVIIVIVLVRKRKLSDPYDHDHDSYDAAYHNTKDLDFRFTLDFNAPYNCSKIQQASRWCTSDQTNDLIGLLCVVRSEDFKEEPIQRGVVLNLSIIFLLAKPAFFRYNKNLH